MQDVTAAVAAMVPVEENTEILWDEVRSSVVLFAGGEPLSLMSLESSENREDTAVRAALKLVKGSGRSLT